MFNQLCPKCFIHFSFFPLHPSGLCVHPAGYRSGTVEWGCLQTRSWSASSVPSLRIYASMTRELPRPIICMSQNDPLLPFFTQVIFLFPVLLQIEEDGWNQLPVCPQEAAFKARGPRAHQRDHTASELRRNISGCVYSRGGAAQACFHMQVCCAIIKHWTHGVGYSLILSSLFLLSICVRYWHRSLNPRKLVEVKFSHLSRNMTLQRTMKLYRLPDVSTLTWFFPVSNSFSWHDLIWMFAPPKEHQDAWPAANGEAWHPPGDRAAAEIPETFPARPFYGGTGGGSLVLAAGQHHWHICSRGIQNQFQSCR